MIICLQQVTKGSPV